MPPDYPVQLWLQANPVEDRLYVRAINMSSSKFALDGDALNKGTMFLSALPDVETLTSGKTIHLSGGGSETMGPVMIFGGGRPPEPFPVVTTVALAPDQYIGCSLSFSDQPWLVEARKAIAHTKDDKRDWTVAAVTSPVMQDAAGEIVPVPNARVLSSNRVELTRGLLAAVGRTVRSKPPATQAAGGFPFGCRASLSDDATRVQVEVVCERPRPAGFVDDKTVPPGANLDPAAVNPSAIAWTLTAAGARTLFATKDAPATRPDPATAAALYLPPDRFLGTSLIVRGAPFFPAMQRFFDTSKDMKAACTLAARLRVRSPGLRPSDPTAEQVLRTAPLRITREEFERMVAAE